jgi:hypothetical protein
MTEEPTPSLTEIAPPSSTRPVATPITKEQMQQDMSKTLRHPGQEKQQVEPAKAEPAKEPQREAPKTSPGDYKSGLREALLKKEPAPKTDEPEVEKPKPVKKEVVSVDDAPPPVKPKADEEVPEDQRQVLPHDKPETARRIRALLDDKKKLAKELDDARKTALAKPTETNVEEFNKLKEEHAKANDELLKFRRRYEVDNDETFKKTYDEPVANAESAIETTLKKYQLGDATLKAIKDEGGFAAFSRSTKTFTVQQKDPDTQEMRAVQVTAGELARQWLNNIPVADAEFIKQSVGKQQMLNEEKKTAVTRAVDESKQFFEQRQAEAKKQQEAAQAGQAEMAKKYQDWYKTTTESTEWLKDKEIPDNATEVQKKAIAETNAFNKQLRDQLNTHPKTSEEYYNLRLESAEAHHLRREMGSKDAEIKRLAAELARVKGGTRTTPKAGSLLTDANKPEQKQEVDLSNPMKSLKENMRSAITKRQGSIDDE